MASLKELLLKDGVRQRMIDDGAMLIDQEVADKKGITGIAIKGGYAFVKKIKKGFVREALDGLLDEFVGEMEPFFEEHGSRDGFGAFMVENKGRLADGLLGVTDKRRDRNSNAALKKAYDKLRPMAKANVEQAVPRLSKMVQKHLDEQSA